MIDQVIRVDHDLTDDLLSRASGAERIAWDIETSGLDWHHGRIGTCQLHSSETGTVIIQLNGRRPDRLAALLADDAVLKVFHHAPFDLRWMTSHWQTPAASVACTKVASRLLNRDPESQVHSLKHLLAQYLGVKIDKGQRTSDWLAANLSSAQLTYAAEDVVHLLPLLDLMEKELVNNNLYSIYQRCLDFLPTRVTLETHGWADVFAY